MRELTDHKVDPANDALTVRVMDEPGSGGACHAYLISGFDNTKNPSDPDDQDPDTCLVLFQNGPINEVGVPFHISASSLLVDVAAPFWRFTPHDKR